MSSMLSTSLQSLSSSSSFPNTVSTELSYGGFRCKQKRLAIRTRKWIVKSVLSNSKLSISDNWANEPSRVLERLFAQTQKLEEQSPELGDLESDLLIALLALQKKEEALQDAEKNVRVDFNKLNRAKEKLEKREQTLASANANQVKLEEELKHSNDVLASQARKIEDLKLLLKERDQEIETTQSGLILKADEIHKLNLELTKKNEEALITQSELESKARVLFEANQIVKRQEIELFELRSVIHEKEAELEASISNQKVYEEKLKVSEVNLEKKTVEWLVLQEELKKLAEEASKNNREVNKTMEDFTRVRKLLGNVKSELISSQKALNLSRKKMEEQDNMLKNHLFDVQEQGKSVMSYMDDLKEARTEVETEKMKHRVSKEKNKELEKDLLMEKELVQRLYKELDNEKTLLEHAINEKRSLQEQIEIQKIEFEETLKDLKVKESELVEAKLEIHHLKSSQASLNLLLEEKDLELSCERKRLEKMNFEIMEMKNLMNIKEETLIQTIETMKETNKHVKVMEHELNDTKMKYFETENAVKRIFELTDKLVISVKNEPIQEIQEEKTKELEMELEFTKQSLRAKEIELLEIQRAFMVKNEELYTVVNKLDSKEKEFKRITRECNELRKMYALAQKRSGAHSIEKLQLKAAQLEIEVASNALHKLTEMSRDLLDKASLSIYSDYDITEVKKDDCLVEVKTKVANLSALTEQLLKEAGIVG